MTKTQAQGLSMVDAERFYHAYTALTDAYEAVYGGIHAARQFKEYHALRDSQQNCYNRYCELFNNLNKEEM